MPPKQQKPWYDWALSGWISPEADDGVRYAERLYSDPTLTIAELAREERCSPSTIRRRMDTARTTMYGTLTRSGFRQRQRRGAYKRKSCEHPGCPESTPARSPSTRGPRPHHCPTHATARARKRRSREAARMRAVGHTT